MQLQELKEKLQNSRFWERFSTQKIKETLSLVWLNIEVSAKGIVEYLRVCCRYYQNPKFFRADASMRLMYLFNHPFSISKRFLKERGDDDLYTYGETPLTTMELIAKECNLEKEDCFYDLGCGRGHLCFWVNAFVGCKAVGIEEIPAFVERANMVKKKACADNVEFINGNYMTADLSGATVIYIYGSNLPDETIEKFAAKLKSLPKGTKLVTVSFPLSDYSSPSSFVTLKRFTGRFVWGEADIYIQVVQ